MSSAPISASRRLAAVLAAGAIALTACATGSQASTTPSAASRVTLTVGSRPGVPAIGSGAIWVPNTGDGTLSRIDPGSNRVVATIRIGDPQAFYQRSCAAYGSVHSFMVTTFDIRLCDLPSAVAAAPNAVWVLRNDARSLGRIDPASNRIVATVPLGAAPWDLAASSTAVWVTSFLEDQVIRIDPQTNRVVRRFQGFSHGPSGIAISGNDVWVVSTFGAAVTRIDAARDAIAAVIPISCPGTCLAGPRPLAIALTPDAVWVRDEGDGTLSRIDPASNALVDTVPDDAFYGRDGVDAMGVTGQSLWVGGVALQQRDVRTGRLIRRLDQTATAVAAAGRILWLTDVTGRVVRMDASG